MHMKYEVPGLVRSVLLPVLLLVWAIIAFFYEGWAWGNNRNVVKERDMVQIEAPAGEMQAPKEAEMKEDQ